MKNIIFSGLYLLFLFCLSTFVFDPMYLYYEIPWLDIPMHLLGGFGVAAFAYAVFDYKGVKLSYTKLMIIYLLVAVAWELYEYIMVILNRLTWDRWMDSAADIVNGWIGVTTVYFFIKRK